MAVVEPRNQLPLAELHLPLRDPLSEFASEEPGPGESNRLTEQALPMDVVAAPNVSLASCRASRGRWLTGAVMLGVGLVAGFAGGVALVTRYVGDQHVPVRSLALNRVDAELPRAQVQPPWTAEPDAAMAEPEPLITGQGASAEPVETIPESTVAVLYVQSRPPGAEVYLDGQLVTTTPFQLSGITPGRHILRIDLQGYRTWSAPVSVEPGARIGINAALEQ